MEKVVCTSGSSFLKISQRLHCVKRWSNLTLWAPFRTVSVGTVSSNNGGITCANCLKLRTLNGLHSLNTESSNIAHSKALGRGAVSHTKLSKKQTQFLQMEIKAFSALLSRSGLNSNQNLSQLFFSGGRHGFSTSTVFCNRDGRDGRDGREEDGRDDKKKDNDDDKMPMLPRLLFWFWLMFALYAGMRLSQGDEVGNFHLVSWNEFYYDMLAKGEVDQVIVRPEMEMAIIQLHPGAIIKDKKVDTNYYTMKIPDPYRFEEKVRKAEAELGVKPEHGISISYQRESSWGSLVMLAMLGLVVFLFLRSMTRVSLPNPSDMFANERKAKFVRVDVMSQQGKGISFKDVAGLKEAKVEVMEFVDYLKSPQRFKELGAKIPHGALLLGPPGCGKTLLAKAVATEARVPFLAMAGSEFVEMLGGLGAARVRDLFKEAKKRAPCIIYIDEIDAIGRKRSGNAFGASMEEEQTLNQLLVEMDGMGTREGVILLASTNRADVLDKALLRPGRFDRHITIDLPTLIERQELFEMYLQKLKLSQAASVHAPKLAQLTPGMSGADIANICNEAAIHAARDKKKVVDAEDFDYAVERVIAGVEKKTHLLAPTEKKVVAYHESGHALVGWMLKYTDALLRISIVPRTNSALGFAQYMPSDQKLYSAEELFERMCMALGGRAAEAVVFNHVTSGAADDLKKVTKMAYDQIRSYGMNENIGHLSFPDTSGEALGTKPYSKKLANIIDTEARTLVARAYKHTEELLMEHKEKLHMLAKQLMEREVLTYDDIQKLIGPPPYGEKKKIEPVGWEGIMPSNDEPSKPSKRKRMPEEAGDS